MHYFGNETNLNKETESTSAFTKIFNEQSSNYENVGEKFSYIKPNDISLEIIKSDNKHLSVECFEVIVNTVNRAYAADESVACFKLSPNYWFGGHESYDQPFWPINNQSFDYKPYITGYPGNFFFLILIYN